MKRQVPSQFGRLVVSVVILGILLALTSGCGAGGIPTAAASPPPSPSGTGQVPPSSPSGTGQVTGENHSPVIDSIISEWLQIERSKSGKIKCVAHDTDGDTLTYSWEADRGKISGNGAIVTYSAPSSYVDAKIIVAVSDGRGGIVYGAYSLSVVCCSAAKKNSEWSE